MKKKSLFTAILLSLCMLVSGSLLAAEQTFDSVKTNFVKAESIELTDVSDPSQFTYKDLSDGTVEITGIKENVVETQLNVKFPSTSDGESSKAVTKIADNAFSENANIYSVTIPASVKTIGEYAFYKCDNLTTLTFDNDSQLEQVGSYAFANEIGDDAGNQSLNKIIGNKITSIQLPKSVKTIEDHAFYNGEQLSEFTFESNSMLTTIGSYAFAGDNMCKHDSVLIGLTVYASAAGLSTFEVPKSVKTIEDHAFYKCSSLTKFTFEAESNLTTIGAYAFAGGEYNHTTGSSRYVDTDIVSNKISSIEIPNSVETIGNYAFYNCLSLTNFTFETGSNLKTIGAYAFSAGKSSKYNTSSYGWNYTSEANKISTIKIPKSVTTIKDHAFYNCKNLVDLTFETGSLLETIESYVFGGEVYLSQTVNVGMSRSFYSTVSVGVKSLTIPKNVKTIEGHAFYLCSSLTNLTFDDDSVLEEIGSYAFGGAVYQSYMGGNEVRYSDKTIGLSSLEIPKSVKTIGDHAFYLSSSLTDLTFETGSLLESIGSYAFGGNTYLTSSNPTSMSSSHVAPQIGSLKIPKSVTTIGDHAFYLCSSLTSLTFEDESSLQTIGNYAFAGTVYAKEEAWKTGYGGSRVTVKCKHTEVLPKFTSLEIPKSVQTIGDYAFYLSSSLIDLTFETGSLLESIGSYAFAGLQYSEITPTEDGNAAETTEYKEVLPKFTSLEIPKSVTTIGNYAFYLNGNLSTLTFDDDSLLEEIGSYAFSGITLEDDETNEHDVVPKISSVKIPKTVTEIGDRAFYYNKTLSTLTFDPQSQLQTIGNSAFANCPAIGEIILPGSVTTLGDTVFDEEIEMICLDSKTQYDALKSKLTPYDEKVTYQITITFKESGAVTRTDYKLWKRGLDWALVDGVWKSGQEVYSFPEGTWRDADKQEFTAETLGQKFTSGEIEDNIVLNKRVIVYRIESDVEGIYATSTEGFEEDTKLKVTEIAGVDQIKEAIGEGLYNENIQKIYVIEFEGTIPADYKIFITKDCTILGDKLGTLGTDEIVEVALGQEDTMLFEDKTGTVIVSKNPTEDDKDNSGKSLWWVWVLVAASASLLILLIIFLILKKSKKEDDDQQNAQ